MKRGLLSVVLGVFAGFSAAAAGAQSPAPASNAATPRVDKLRFAGYVRYAEGLTDAVAISVEDPVPSAYRDYYRMVVHLTAGQMNLGDKVYYVSPDGQQFVNGTVWGLNESPFRDTLTLLPSKGPSFGAADAKVTVVVFSDFQCPFCKQLAENIRQNIPKTFPNDVRVIFADFPLEGKHPWARAAAEAAHCIGDNNTDAFWAFHDWIFAHQGDIDPKGANFRDKILEFSKSKGWDAPKIGTCMSSNTTAPEVIASEQKAYVVGVSQTPTIFVNGRKVEGALPWQNLEALLQFELHRPKEIPITAR